MQEQFGNSPRIIDSGLPTGNTDPRILKPFVKGIATEKEKIEKLEQKKLTSFSGELMPVTPKPQTNKDSGDIEESLTELSGELKMTLKQGLLTTLNALDESVKQLATSNASLLSVENPDVRRPSESDYLVARQNMDTLARLVQSKVNLIKAYRS